MKFESDFAELFGDSSRAQPGKIDALKEDPSFCTVVLLNDGLRFTSGVDKTLVNKSGSKSLSFIGCFCSAIFASSFNALIVSKTSSKDEHVLSSFLISVNIVSISPLEMFGLVAICHCRIDVSKLSLSENFRAA